MEENEDLAVMSLDLESSPAPLPNLAAAPVGAWAKFGRVKARLSIINTIRDPEAADKVDITTDGWQSASAVHEVKEAEPVIPKAPPPPKAKMSQG